MLKARGYQKTSLAVPKASYQIHVISDCVTSYDLKRLDEMFAYYEKKLCAIKLEGLTL